MINNIVKFCLKTFNKCNFIDYPLNVQSNKDILRFEETILSNYIESEKYELIESHMVEFMSLEKLENINLSLEDIEYHNKLMKLWDNPKWNIYKWQTENLKMYMNEN